MANEHLTVRAIQAESWGVSTDVVDGALVKTTTYALHLYNRLTVTGTAEGDDEAARMAAREQAVSKILPVALALQGA